MSYRIITVCGFEQLTLDATTAQIAKPKTAVDGTKPNACLISVITQNLRIQHGANPTSSVGQRILATQLQPYLWTGPMSDLRLIGEVAGSVVDIMYVSITR